MVRKTEKSGSSRYGTKRARRKPSKKGSSHWFLKLFLIFTLAFSVALFSYLSYLDFSVREQFEGKRWAIPARVYANPVDIYPGLAISSDKFEQLLGMLHYREDVGLSSEGTYFTDGETITVRTREFSFWDSKQPSFRMQLTFKGGAISAISDIVQNQDLPILRLDPVQIGSFYPTIKEDRILIKLNEAPELLIKGLLASEDRDFYSHFGISVRGIARALWADFRAGGMVQGGSTITQQLVKNFYLTSERSLARKLKEMCMALILEYRYSKDEILEAYLNEIYLGQDGASSVHGFGLASEFYFGSSLRELSLDQLAVLVALVRGPSQYEPRLHPKNALQRRNLVLDEMADQGYISGKDALMAQAQPLNVIPNTHKSINRYPGFLDLVKRQLREDYREQDLTSEGLRIFTTLDPMVQETLEKTITTKLAQLEKLPLAKKLETAVIVTRRDNGEVAALSSGRENLAGGFNHALDAVRPIGSLIKPMVYLTALEYPDKYTITTPVSDTSITIKSKGGADWTPKNFDHKEHGTVPLHTALAKSYNLATVHVGTDIGVARIAKTLRDIGVSRKVELFPSFLLGAASLTPMDVTLLYQTLAGDGFATPIKTIRAVIATDGTRLQSYPFTIKQVVDPSATFIVNTILQEVMHAGTGKSAYSVFPKDYGLVGKTGTTNDAKDSWFAGYTGDYLSVVWVGRDDNKPIGLTGGAGALQVWTALMKQISTQPVKLTPPDNIKMALVDPYTGLLANPDCPGAKSYPYISDSEPTVVSECGSPPEDINADEPEEGQDKSWFKDVFQ